MSTTDQMVREVRRAIQWLEILMYDHEYGQCGGCRGRNFGPDAGKHEHGCPLKSTVDDLKTYQGPTHNTGTGET